MELTRRDALAALMSAGVVGGGTVAVLARDESDDGDCALDDESEAAREALVATAHAVYPSGIENPQGHPGGTDTYQRGPPG
jgi:hypothetical protein